MTIIRLVRFCVMTSRIIAPCISAPSSRERDNRDNDRQRVRQPEFGHRIPGDERAQHVQLAVREIHQPRDAEQDGPAERDAGVAGAEHEAVDDLLGDIHARSPAAIVPRYASTIRGSAAMTSAGPSPTIRPRSSR